MDDGWWWVDGRMVQMIPWPLFRADMFQNDRGPPPALLHLFSALIGCGGPTVTLVVCAYTIHSATASQTYCGNVHSQKMSLLEWRNPEKAWCTLSVTDCWTKAHQSLFVLMISLITKAWQHPGFLSVFTFLKKKRLNFSLNKWCYYL